ncbi:AsnC family protein [Rhodococcus sp. 3Y1]
MLKDDDLRLLNALQIRPRASWSELSRAIGSDPVTLTRRWERLHSQGIAWIAAYRGGPIVSATALRDRMRTGTDHERCRTDRARSRSSHSRSHNRQSGSARHAHLH